MQQRERDQWNPVNRRRVRQRIDALLARHLALLGNEISEADETYVARLAERAPELRVLLEAA
jgi:hypothetical protein